FSSIRHSPSIWVKRIWPFMLLPLGRRSVTRTMDCLLAPASFASAAPSTDTSLYDDHTLRQASNLAPRRVTRSAATTFLTAAASSDLRASQNACAAAVGVERSGLVGSAASVGTVITTSAAQAGRYRIERGYRAP